MRKITFELPSYTIEQIKKDYFLNKICVNGTAQIENIAITIESLYFYHNLLNGPSLPKTIRASICRTFVIMSYSIIEAIVISVGYLIQKKCLICKHRCSAYSLSMFSHDKHNNEIHAFENASEYLTAQGIIQLTANARLFYDGYRSNRNNIHLARNAEVIDESEAYTVAGCNAAFNFLQGFICLIYENFKEFKKLHKCN